MNESKSIIITGAGGFIGSALVSYFRLKQWRVTALVHTFPAIPERDVIYVKYDLAGMPDEGAFESADYLVHCAYIKNDIETNISGMKKLLEVSRRYNIKKDIFLSSFSARENAISKYGRQKLAIEKLFNTERDCVVRAGIVLGNGALFKQMSEHIRKRKRIPLINGGRQPVQTIHVNDLALVIDKIIEQDFSGIITAAEPEAVTYKEFFTALSKKLGVKPKFIPVSFFLLNYVLALAEALHIRLPIARENVLGLKLAEVVETKEDLKRLGVKIRNYRESLRDI